MKTMLNITKIREQLPHGAQTEIAKRANVHLNLVHRVLHGQSQNIKVLTAIADYIIELKENEKSTLDKLASFIN